MRIMIDNSEQVVTTEEWLSFAKGLVPKAIDKAKDIKVFQSKWKSIIARLAQIPSKLSDLSTHPCFAKNALCKEQLQSVSKTLQEAIDLAESCLTEKYEGKLKMQSELDALVGKLDLSLRDCGLLIRTGVLGDFTSLSTISSTSLEGQMRVNVREMLARLQIGHLEAKHKALDKLVELMQEDEKNVLSVIERSNITALVRLLTTTSPQINEKAITIICTLAESGNFQNFLVEEGIIPPLIRLVECGSPFCKEKAVISLQRLSKSVDASRSIVKLNGTKPLIEICRTCDSITQAASACTLKNLSTVPELRKVFEEEGTVRTIISLLKRGILMGSKESASECLQNLTSDNDSLSRLVISQGGITTLAAYIDSVTPQESAVGALRNLVKHVSSDVIISANLIPILAKVIQTGSLKSQQKATEAICTICDSNEMKRLIGEHGIIPLLVNMLEAKDNGLREVAARAILSLMRDVSQNLREVKKIDESVPNLVALLDSNPHNTGKKYAVSCLLMLCLSSKCKKMMVSYGAIGYLKKLRDMEVAGANKLLEVLERSKFRSFFSMK